MTVVLAIEIACALAACGALLALMAQAVRLNRKSKEQPADRLERLHRRHRSIGFVLLAAGIVHGISATIYASGARTEAYVMGWASIVLFALSGVCMAPPVRARLPHAASTHVFLFALGSALFIGHATPSWEGYSRIQAVAEQTPLDTVRQLPLDFPARVRHSHLPP